MGRATLGVFQSTPTGIVAAESKLHLQGHYWLDYRQARFAQRLPVRPQGHKGPDEIKTR